MNLKKTLCAFLALIVIIASCVTALAKVPQPSDEFYFYDAAGVLSEPTKGEIFFSNELLNDACGAQIVVAAVKTTGSQAIDDYTNEMFNAWGIGDKDKQNGFLLLMAIEDEDYYALCGSKLQSKFTSGSLKQYFDNYLETDFAAGRYDDGARKFFEAVFARISDTYNAGVTTAQGIAAYEDWAAQGSRTDWAARSGGGSLNRSGYADPEEGNDMTVLIVAVVVLILVFLLVSRSRRRYYGGSHFFFPIFFGGFRRNPPPPPGGPYGAGPGGYRGMPGGPMPGTGGYRGTPNRRSNIGTGILYGILRSMGSGSSGSSGGSSRSSSFRSSGSSSFGSARGGGGFSRGGGAGRGRH